VQSHPAKRCYSEIIFDAKQRLLASEFGEVECAWNLGGVPATRTLHAARGIASDFDTAKKFRPKATA
jgi:hypothetical protein